MKNCDFEGAHSLPIPTLCPSWRYLVEICIGREEELPLGDKIFILSAYAENHACVPKLLWRKRTEDGTSAYRHGLHPWMNAKTVPGLIMSWSIAASADSA